MKGLLLSKNHSYIISATDVTTIGKSEECDLVITTPQVADEHAEIMWSDTDGGFVLQDLGSYHGTYINDCRVENASVRLASGDCVQFGKDGEVFSFSTETDTELLPVARYRNYYQPLTFLDADGGVASAADSALPQLRISNSRPESSSSLTSLERVANNGPIMQQPARANLSSPSVGRHTISSINKSIQLKQAWTPQLLCPKLNNSYTALSSVEHLAQSAASLHSNSTGRTVTIATNRSPDENLELNKKYLPGVEMHSSATHYEHSRGKWKPLRSSSVPSEADILRRDAHLAQLQDEIWSLQEILGDNGMQGPGYMDLFNRLGALEDEVHKARSDVSKLAEQVVNQRNSRINDITQQTQQMKIEVEKLSTERNNLAQLTGELQLDVTNKNKRISHMTEELENVNLKLAEQEGDIIDLNSRLSVAELGAKEEKANAHKLIANVRQLEGRNHELDQSTKTREQLLRDAQSMLQEKVQNIKCLSEKLEISNQEMNELRSQHREQTLICNKLETTIKEVMSDFSTANAQYEKLHHEMKESKQMLGIDEETEFLDGIKLTLQLHQQALEVANDKLVRKSEQLFQSVKQFSDTVSQAQETLAVSGMTSASVQSAVNLLNNSSHVSDEVKPIQESFIRLFSVVCSWMQAAEESVEEWNLEDSASKTDFLTWLQRLHSEYTDVLLRDQELLHIIDGAKSAQQEELQAVKQEAERDCQKKVAACKEEMCSEWQERLTCAVDQVKTDCDKHQKELAKCQTLIEDLQHQVVKRQQESDDQKLVANEQAEKIKQLTSKCLDLKLEKETLSEELDRRAHLAKEKHESCLKLQEEVINLKSALESRRDEQVAAELRVREADEKYKHSVTEAEILTSRVQDLQRQLKDAGSSRSVVAVAEEIDNNLRSSKRAGEASAKIIPSDDDRKRSSSEQVEKLKSEKKRQELEIEKLHELVVTSSARNSEQKGLRVEKLSLQVNRKEEELLQVRVQLAKMSELVDLQTNELKQKSEEIRKHKKLTSRYKQEASSRSEELSTLEDRMKLVEATAKNAAASNQRNSNLITAGSACLENNHDHIITRQREALSEMRERIVELQEIKKDVTSEQLAHQVSVLKKQLSEFRVHDALQENKHLNQLIIPQHHNSEPAYQTDLALERTAHQETKDTLENSEDSYLNMAHSIANQLRVSEPHALHSLTHLPADQQHGIMTARKNLLQHMSSALSELLEKISRKEDMLRDYELNLKKLRIAESLAQEKAKENNLALDNLHESKEEVEYLQEALRKLRESLQWEKKLNAAIKEKKKLIVEAPGFRSHRQTGLHQQ